MSLAHHLDESHTGEDVLPHQSAINAAMPMFAAACRFIEAVSYSIRITPWPYSSLPTWPQWVQLVGRWMGWAECRPYQGTF